MSAIGNYMDQQDSLIRDLRKIIGDNEAKLKTAVEALEKIDDIDCSQTAMERTAYLALEKLKQQAGDKG